MKVALITPTPPDISAFGVRSLSAILKKYKYDVKSIFLPGGIEILEPDGTKYYKYSRNVLDQIYELVKEDDIIGISFMSPYLDRAIQITNYLKKKGKNWIIWGGTHPTVAPEQSLNYVDIVCVGEADYAFLKFLERLNKGKEYLTTPSFYFKKDSEIIRNPLDEPINNLDELPFFDFELENHFLLDPIKDEIIALNKEKFKNILPLMPYFGDKILKVYRTMTSRGCPHACTYCVNEVLLKMHRNGSYLRWRSIENVMLELENVLKKYPFIEGIQFFDDVFTSMPKWRLKKFVENYKKRISLPFYCQASPSTLDSEKMEILIEGGMVFIEMGIQTGSQRIQEMYQRPESVKKILESSQIINKYKNYLIKPHYHLILDNPWENERDRYDTLRLLTKIPKPYQLCLSSLVFYPGTLLYKKAKREGLLKDEFKEIYRKAFYKPTPTYVNFLITLADVNWFPNWIFKYMGLPAVQKIFSNKIFNWVWKFGIKSRHLGRLMAKGLKAVFRGDINRIKRFLVRIK